MKSPDKLSDSRPEMLIATPTIGETLEQARLIQSMSSGPIRYERLENLNERCLQLEGDYLQVQTTGYFQAYPNGVPYTHETVNLSGGFMGYFSMDGDESSSEGSKPPIAIGVHRGETEFKNQYTKGTFDINSFASVGEVVSVTSITELRRLVSVSGEYDPEKTLEKLLRVMDLMRRTAGKKPLYDDFTKISLIEPWDFRGPSVSIRDFRRLRLDVVAERARVMFTDKDNGKPFWIEEKDLAFSGYFWATSSLLRPKQSHKPNFVFELYTGGNKDIEEMYHEDPTKMTPLVYVPISDHVSLEVEPA